MRPDGGGGPAAPAAPEIDARVHHRVLVARGDEALDDAALATLVRSEAPLLSRVVTSSARRSPSSVVTASRMNSRVWAA